MLSILPSCGRCAACRQGRPNFCCYLGSARVERDVPRLADLYQAGELLLDELISRRVGLDELDEAFARLRAGEGARQLLVLDY